MPEGTPLNLQLLQFQRLRRRVAFIVDEYGDVQGLVTLEDLLEEIVGEFTSGTSALHKDVHRERPDSFVVNASASVRTLKRDCHLFAFSGYCFVTTQFSDRVAGAGLSGAKEAPGFRAGALQPRPPSFRS